MSRTLSYNDLLLGLVSFPGLVNPMCRYTGFGHFVEVLERGSGGTG